MCEVWGYNKKVEEIKAEEQRKAEEARKAEERRQQEQKAREEGKVAFNEKGEYVGEGAPEAKFNAAGQTQEQSQNQSSYNTYSNTENYNYGTYNDTNNTGTTPRNNYEYNNQGERSLGYVESSVGIQKYRTYAVEKPDGTIVTKDSEGKDWFSMEQKEDGKFHIHFYGN